MSYTIGEIERMGLLLNRNGMPYKGKSRVSQVLRSVPHETKQTPWGIAKIYTKEVIEKLNQRWNKSH